MAAEGAPAEEGGKYGGMTTRIWGSGVSPYAKPTKTTGTGTTTSTSSDTTSTTAGTSSSGTTSANAAAGSSSTATAASPAPAPAPAAASSSSKSTKSSSSSKSSTPAPAPAPAPAAPAAAASSSSSNKSSSESKTASNAAASPASNGSNSNTASPKPQKSKPAAAVKPVRVRPARAPPKAVPGRVAAEGDKFRAMLAAGVPSQKGLLRKRGGFSLGLSVLKSWQPRWVVLNGPYLTYYETENSSALRGMYVLEGAAVVHATTKQVDSMWVFQLNTATQEPELFIADSADTFNAWKTALDGVINTLAMFPPPGGGFSITASTAGAAGQGGFSITASSAGGPAVGSPPPLIASPSKAVPLCANCHAALEPGDRFCSECGVVVAT